ncbi:MAG: peptide-methionine (S)-S-oxide reductase [Thermoplasmata archaeon]|nr:peptide-methionine (S)-S-oxide reductase [Thermoplasmata archaeon]
MEKATFAAEPLQAVEAAFRAVAGVRGTRIGRTDDPAYGAVEVEYDPWKVSYDDLLEIFWRERDPIRSSAIFPHTVEQHVAAAASLDRVERATTEIVPASRFRPA